MDAKLTSKTAKSAGLDQLQARYVPGLGIDKPVLMDRGGTFSYYHYDGTGSVVAVTDGFGTVVESYAYGPYGESADGDLIGNPYRFTGRRLDAETELYYYRNRYYSATLGRFLQADPAGFVDGLNLYAYVRNDPLNFVDPSGLFTLVFNATVTLVILDDVQIQISGGLAFDSSTFEFATVKSEATAAVGLMAIFDVGVQLFPSSRLSDIENPTEVIGGGLGIGGAAIFDARTGEPIGGELTFGPSAGVIRSQVDTTIGRLGRVDPYGILDFNLFGRAFGSGLGLNFGSGSLRRSGSLGK